MRLGGGGGDVDALDKIVVRDIVVVRGLHSGVMRGLDDAMDHWSAPKMVVVVGLAFLAYAVDRDLEVAGLW